jgi:hypothetical protein
MEPEYFDLLGLLQGLRKGHLSYRVTEQADQSVAIEVAVGSPEQIESAESQRSADNWEPELIRAAG